MCFEFGFLFPVGVWRSDVAHPDFSVIFSCVGAACGTPPAFVGFFWSNYSSWFAIAFGYFPTLSPRRVTWLSEFHCRV